MSFIFVYHPLYGHTHTHTHNLAASYSSSLIIFRTRFNSHREKGGKGAWGTKNQTSKQAIDTLTMEISSIYNPGELDLTAMRKMKRPQFNNYKPFLT